MKMLPECKHLDKTLHIITKIYARQDDLLVERLEKSVIGELTCLFADTGEPGAPVCLQTGSQ